MYLLSYGLNREKKVWLNWQCFSICPLLIDDRVNRNLTYWHPIIQFSINPCWHGVWLKSQLHYFTYKTWLRGSYALQFVLMAGLYISKAQCGIYVTMRGYFRDYSKTLFSCLKWRRLVLTLIFIIPSEWYCSFHLGLAREIYGRNYVIGANRGANLLGGWVRSKKDFLAKVRTIS